MIGIYGIVCIGNNKVYVGRAVDVQDRWRTHLRDLKRGTHYNALVQRSWDKYGQDMFGWIVLEECQENELVEREQHWLDQDPGLNLSLVAEYNVRPSLETRDKISSMLKEHYKDPDNRAKTAELTRLGMTDEVRAKISKALKGKKRSPHSSETRAKISRALKGKSRGPRGPLPLETRAKISEAAKRQWAEGRGAAPQVVSEETKRKISIANTGKKRTPEQRRKMSDAHRGQSQTLEARAKISAALKKHHADRAA